jgi:hypothetical protein
MDSIVRQVQLCLEVVNRQSRDGLITEDVVQGAVAQRLVVVVHIDAILVVRQQSGKLHRALLVTD